MFIYVIYVYIYVICVYIYVIYVYTEWPKIMYTHFDMKNITL